MNRRKFLVTSATVAVGFPLFAKSQSAQDFVWEKVVPIAQRYDPRFVCLLPRSWWYNHRSKELTDRIAEINKRGCHEANLLFQTDDYVKAHVDMVYYTKSRHIKSTLRMLS